MEEIDSSTDKGHIMMSDLINTSIQLIMHDADQEKVNVQLSANIETNKLTNNKKIATILEQIETGICQYDLISDDQ
jgi:hypothetical protein